MAKLTLFYSTEEEKQQIIADISKSEKFKILKVSKEYPGKFNKVYIELKAL